jgi:hypothetical protein
VTGDGSDGTSDERSDLEGLMARRLAEYVALWEGAATKFSNSSYRSEDLLDDWFALCGKAARDMTAGAALWWGAAGGVRPGRSLEEEPTRGPSAP